MSFSGWFLFFIITVTFFMMLLLAPLTVRIKIHNLRDDNNIVLLFSLSLFRRVSILVIHRTMGAKDERGEKGVSLNLFLNHLLEKVRDPSGIKQLQGAGKYLLQLGYALDWHDFTILLKVGTGDAAVTGIKIGLLRTLGNILSYMLQERWRFKERSPLILAYPYFLENKFKFYITAECGAAPVILLYRMLSPIKKSKG